MLLLKLLLVPGLVALVTLAVRQWGQVVGGWLAGLPIVAGPVLVFYALEQGDAFAARAAHATLAGLIATVAFAVTYAVAAARLRWYACMPIGWSMFALVIVTLYALQPGLVLSLALLVAATIAGRGVLRRVRALGTSKGAEPGLHTTSYVGRVPLTAAPQDDLVSPKAAPPGAGSSTRSPCSPPSLPCSRMRSEGRPPRRRS